MSYSSMLVSRVPLLITVIASLCAVVEQQVGNSSLGEIILSCDAEQYYPKAIDFLNRLHRSDCMALDTDQQQARLRGRPLKGVIETGPKLIDRTEIDSNGSPSGASHSSDLNSDAGGAKKPFDSNVSFSMYFTVEDFRRCSLPMEHVCIPEYGAVESWWNNSIYYSVCMQGKHPIRIRSHEESVQELVKNMKCKYLIASGVTAAVATSGENCGKIARFGELVMEHGLSMIMPVDADEGLFRHIERATMDMMENNALDTLEDYFEKRGSCRHRREEVLTYEKVHVFFLVTYASIAVIFLTKILEKRRRRGEHNIEHVDTVNDRNQVSTV